MVEDKAYQEATDAEQVELQDAHNAEPTESPDQILDAIKELTKQIVELTKTVNAMKDTHDKWVRAGKF